MSPEQRRELLMMHLNDLQAEGAHLKIGEDASDADKLAMLQHQLSILKGDGVPVDDLEAKLKELYSNQPIVLVADENGLFTTPTAKPTTPADPGNEWQWGNVAGQWVQMPNASTSSISTLDRVTAVVVPEYASGYSPWMSAYGIGSAGRGWYAATPRGQNNEPHLDWTSDVTLPNLKSVEVWAGWGGHATSLASQGLLFAAKSESHNILGEAWGAQTQRIKSLASSYDMRDAGLIFKDPNRAAASALGQAATRYGSSLRMAGVLGNAFTIAEEVAWQTRIVSENPELRGEAFAASAMNISGDIGATAWGMKIGAGIGIVASPFLTPLAIPVLAAVGGFAFHAAYNYGVQPKIRVIFTGPDPSGGE